MEPAAFELLAPALLTELGRLAVNFGFAEFLLDQHLAMLFRIGDVGAKASLVTPLATRRKLEILLGSLERIPKADTRRLVEEGCKLLERTLVARNEMLHGIWGYDGPAADATAVCVTRKRQSGHRAAVEISSVADTIAVATRKLLDAAVVDGGGKPTAQPERLVIVLG